MVTKRVTSFQERNTGSNPVWIIDSIRLVVRTRKTLFLPIPSKNFSTNLFKSLLVDLVLVIKRDTSCGYWDCW